ncbi:MAG: hypothetical protein WA102_04195 [Candidatus Methanoperedens sp.]
MYPLMEREFDRVLKRAMPYLIFSPDSVRDNVADYMKSIWLAMRNGNQVDFDLCYKNVNEAIANSEGCTDSFLQCNISDFNERWSGLDESISKLRRELIELRAEVKNMKKDSSPVIEEVEKRKRGRLKKASSVIDTVTDPVPTTNQPIVDAPNILETNVPTKGYVEQSISCVKEYLLSNREITNPDVRKLCGINIYQAKCLLHKLVQENFVEQKGRRRGTKYVLRE